MLHTSPAGKRMGIGGLGRFNMEPGLSRGVLRGGKDAWIAVFVTEPGIGEKGVASVWSSGSSPIISILPVTDMCVNA
jgi:hypothetical protein